MMEDESQRCIEIGMELLGLEKALTIATRLYSYHRVLNTTSI
jgi:hypothetical protein